MQYRKIPAKPEKGRPFILKLFYDLYNLVRDFFFGKEMSKVEEMFNNINTGIYKDKVPYQTSLSFANKGVIDIDEAFATSDDELREALLSDNQRSEVLQSMTYYTIRDLIDKDESLFNLADHITKNRSELYDYLQKRLIVDLRNLYGAEGGRNMMRMVISDWDNILKRHEEYLRQYNIEFDENDELQVKDENKIKESDYVEANKIDHLKKANSAMKMLLSTIPMTDAAGKAIRSTMGGPKLLPLNRVWVSLLNKLHSSRTVEEMMYNLKEMAKEDSNYRGLFKRLTKRDWNYEVNTPNAIELSHVTNEHSARLLSSFYSLFRKTNPEVQTVTIFDNGEISVGDTNLSTFAAQLKSDFVNEMILAAKNGSRYFVYNPKRKTYSGNKETIKGAALTDANSMVNFLKEIGIVFNLRDVQGLSTNKFNKFKEAVAGIRKSISDGEELATISGRTLKMNNRLLDLGYIQAGITHPEFESTFFNISGERTQSFIGTNPASDLYDILSKIDNIEELRGTRYEYILTDSFAQGSNVIRRMFSRSGRRVENDESKKLMKTAYISGTDNISKGKRKESSKLSQKERFIQELNLNIAGYYLNLVPGDASMEHALYMGNAVTLEEIKRGMDSIHNIFRGYFISELEMVRESAIRESSMAKLPKGRRRNANEMRFFKSILGDQLHREVLRDSNLPAEEIYRRFEGKINRAIEGFIYKQNTKLEFTLMGYGIIRPSEQEGTSMFENINFDNNLSENPDVF